MTSMGGQQPISPARRFLDAQIAKHPTIYGVLCILGAIASFFLNGHVVVWAARWIIRVSGYIAESALLFAVLWISGTSVAPGLAEFFMSKQLMQYLVWLALITLALIPEIILANAIVNVVGRWYAVARDWSNVGLWIWAALFTIPTFMFLILTAITLNTLGANGGNFVQASTSMVNLRLDAGWIYGLLELTYAGVKKFTAQKPQMNTPAPQPQATASQPQPLQQLEEMVATFNHRLQELNTKLEEMRAQPSQEVTLLATQMVLLTEQVKHLQSEQQVDSELTEEATENQPPTEALPDGESDASSVGKTNGKPIRLVKTKASPSTGRGEAVKRAQRIIKRNPQITPTELAKRAKISRSYASQLIAQQTA